MRTGNTLHEVLDDEQLVAWDRDDGWVPPEHPGLGAAGFKLFADGRLDYHGVVLAQWHNGRWYLRQFDRHAPDKEFRDWFSSTAVESIFNFQDRVRLLTGVTT